jgi:hypothetical protein
MISTMTDGPGGAPRHRRNDPAPDALSMHKHSAPSVSPERARAAHEMGVELQQSATPLDAQHRRQARRARTWRRSAGWFAVLVLVLAVAAAWWALAR